MSDSDQGSPDVTTSDVEADISDEEREQLEKEREERLDPENRPVNAVVDNTGREFDNETEDFTYAAGEEPGAVHGDRLARHREPLDHRVVVPLGARLKARQGQTALRAPDDHAVRLDQPRVHHMAEMADVLVVGAVVDEDPQGLPHLVRREAHALRGVHRREQVLHEIREFRSECGDLRTGCVQDGVAEQGEGPDSPTGARNGAVAHGRKGTAIRECDWISNRLTTTTLPLGFRRGAYARRIEI